ncbi:uncharacterized protein LOC125509419 isoform X3 [Triticum urartu]|uniref:uncharacterized protein LOC125509419 isoform X3 n=1 Tax=Triticum urartu TaxID=4572 RepID=UPI002043D5F7|nr:uncharacterized protein LOC125509419 isoform X3 [Triticum urartu]
MECRVMMSPAPSPEQAAARDKIDPDHCTLDECVRDFSKIDELLMPLFKDEKGQLPVYFDDLSSDLRTKSVVAALWSKENFNYHPAVMPSPARRTLTGGIHYSARAFKLSTDGRYKRLLEECPFDEDWRYTPMIEDDPIMSGVYWFENANKDRDLDEYENTVISALGMQRLEAVRDEYYSARAVRRGWVERLAFEGLIHIWSSPDHVVDLFGCLSL